MKKSFREKHSLNTSQHSKTRSFREKYSLFIVLSLAALAALYFFRDEKIFGTLFFIAIHVFGLDVVWVNYSGRQKAKQSMLWPTTIGTLIKAHAEEEYCQDNTYRWFLNVHYSYSVANQNFSNDKYYWVNPASSSQKKMDKLADDIRSKPVLNVRYNPKNYSESIIEPTVSIIYYVGMVVGLLISLCGLGLLLQEFGLIDITKLLPIITGEQFFLR